MAAKKKQTTTGSAKKTPAKAAATKVTAESLDKAKLTAALESVNTRYGKGSLIMADSTTILEVDRIPFDHIDLDEISGGGVPRGKITEFIGETGGGKCLTADSFVISPEQGMVTIDELWQLNGFKATCSTRTELNRVPLLNGDGREEHTAAFTWNGRRPVHRIQTQSGLTLKATPNHPIRVIDENGFVVWRKTVDLKPGDYAAVMRGHGVTGKTDLISDDDARLLGYLVADGCNTDATTVRFSNSDPDVVRDYMSLMTARGVAVTSYGKANSKTVDHHSTAVRPLRTKLAEQGLAYVKSAEKRVPWTVRRSTESVQRAFLNGYFELECDLQPVKRAISVTSASEELLREVQMMLLNFGFVGRRSPKKVKGYDQTYWSLTYYGDEGRRLGEWLDFKSAARREKFGRFGEIVSNTNIDTIPHLEYSLRSLRAACETGRSDAALISTAVGNKNSHDVSYAKLNSLIARFENESSGTARAVVGNLKSLRDSHYFCDEIVSVDYAGDEPTFDFNLPETHSFWSNGLVSHNTSAVCRLVISAQKRGLRCAVVDTEQAIDLKDWEKRGVDTSELLFSQPASAEEALDIVNVLAKSGVVDFIALDSVAALCTRRELEGEAGDEHRAEVARLLSKELKKLLSPVKKNNVAVVFVNQYRDGMGYAATEKKPTGGRALKFYASLRMEFTRIKNLSADYKGDKVYYAQETQVKCPKNRTAPPHRQATVELRYGIELNGVVQDGGFDEPTSILARAVEKGIMKQNKAWYYYGEQGFQGKEKARDFVAATPAIKEAVLAA